MLEVVTPNGSAYTERRASGYTVKEALAEIFPPVTIATGHWWNRQKHQVSGVPEIPTLDYYFDSKPTVRVSPDGKHIISVGFAMDNAFIMRDDKILTTHKPGNIYVVEGNEDYSHAFIETETLDGSKSILKIYPDNIATIITGQSSIHREYTIGLLGGPLVYTATDAATGKQSMMFAGWDYERPKFPIRNADFLEAVPYDSSDPEGFQGWVASNSKDNESYLTLISDKGNIVQQIHLQGLESAAGIEADEIERDEKNPGKFQVQWAQTIDGRLKAIGLNEEIFEKSTDGTIEMLGSDDMENIFTSKEIEPSAVQISRNGKAIAELVDVDLDTAWAEVNGDTVFYFFSSVSTKEQFVFCSTPEGPTLLGPFESVEILGFYNQSGITFKASYKKGYESIITIPRKNSENNFDPAWDDEFDDHL